MTICHFPRLVSRYSLRSNLLFCCQSEKITEYIYDRITQNHNYNMIYNLFSTDLIVFFTIGFIWSNSIVFGIRWNENWAFSCDFDGNDLSNVQCPGELCSTKCGQTSGCTHFAWTNYNGGTCWMKSGPISKSNAIHSSDPSIVCGVLNDNPTSGDIINEEKFRCIFNNLDDRTRRQQFDGLKQSGWKPTNVNEAAVFLAHVYHESDGLQTMTEYCAPGRDFSTIIIFLEKFLCHKVVAHIMLDHGVIFKVHPASYIMDVVGFNFHGHVITMQLVKFSV